MDKEFTCCQCTIEFNGTTRTPHVLPSCGHSICHACLTQFLETDMVLTCKEDEIQCTVERDLKNFPHNISILNLIKKRRSSNRCQTAIVITPDDTQQRYSAQDVSHFSGGEGDEHQMGMSQSQEQLPKANICPIHHKVLELVCMEDGQYICVNCALFGNHKFHNYKPIETYVKELEQSINEITPVFEEVKGYLTEIESNKFQQLYQQTFEQSKENTKQQFKLQFQDLISQLKQIEQNVCENIDSNYEYLKTQNLDKINNNYANIRKIADAWIANTSQQICQFFEGNQQKCCNLDTQLLNQGQYICSEYKEQTILMDQMVQEIQKQNQHSISIQEIIHFVNSKVGLEQEKQRKEEKEQNDFSLIDDNTKLMDSDVFLQNPPSHQFEFKAQVQQLQPQSQQPTQPTSPSYDLQKQQHNYFSNMDTSSISHRKERSHTTLQTEPPQLENSGHITSRFKPKSSQKQLKFTNNSKMNEKLSHALSMIHEDKHEIIDLTQIDFNDQIIGILDEYLKGKKSIKVLKMNKCRITDDLFQKLISSVDDCYVQTLHLQSNLISEKSIDFLLAHLRKSEKFCHIKQLYLNTNALTLLKVKKKIEELKKLGVVVSI